MFCKKKVCSTWELKYPQIFLFAPEFAGGGRQLLNPPFKTFCLLHWRRLLPVLMLQLVFIWLPKPLPSGGTEPARPVAIYTHSGQLDVPAMLEVSLFILTPFLDMFLQWSVSNQLRAPKRSAQAGNCSHLLNKTCLQQEHRFLGQMRSPSFFAEFKGYTWARVRLDATN